MTRTVDFKARLSNDSCRVAGFRTLLLGWYAHAGRTFPWRRESTPRYVQVVSEVLLQRTRADVVAAFLPRFLASFPSWSRLATAEISQLEAMLQPLGLWRRRAIALQALGRAMERRRGRFPRSRGEIETLPGVGQYVASAAMLFCHGAREPLLDVNMARVVERFFRPRSLADIRYDPWLQAITRQIVDHDQAKSINWAMLDLAATICTSRAPKCDSCPLQKSCRHAKDRLLATRT